MNTMRVTAPEELLEVRPADAIDPITFSVIMNKFNTIAKEMTLTLEYTATSSLSRWC